MSAPAESMVPLATAPRSLEILDVKGYEPLFRRLAALVGLPPDRVIAVPGCTYAMHVALRSTLSPGEEAVLETPTYELLPRILESMGVSAVPVTRKAGEGFALRVEDLARAIGPRTRAVVLTSPHNPSGRILPEGDAAALADLARSRGIPVIVDEVYLDFHPRDQRGFASLAQISEHFVVAGSLTKAHGLSGLRLGWIAGPRDVIDEAWRWQEILADRVPALDAQAACVALDHIELLRARAWDAYRVGFPIVRAWADGAGLEILDPGAGITAVVRLPAGVDSLALANRLFEEQGVLVPPGEMFGIPGWLRISFAIPDAALREGLSAIGDAIRRGR